MTIAQTESEPTLAGQLAEVLNSNSAENASNTADFILAEFLRASLRALDEAIKSRDTWYGIAPRPGASNATEDPVNSYGLTKIENERKRQIREHGFDAERDDRYRNGELVMAAMHYADPPEAYVGVPQHVRPFWPSSWDSRYDQKDTDDRLSQLAKAGALIAAEIDRLLRIKQRAMP